METRICRKCEEEKPINRFKDHLSKGRRYRQWKCKDCINLEDKLRGRSRINRAICDDRYKEKWREARSTRNFTSYQIQQLDRRRIYTTEYHRKRKAGDPFFKLTCNIRNRVRVALKRKGFKKISKFFKYIGCSVEKLKDFLEEQFDEKMSWENYGSYWSIDHIIPLSYANDEEELYKLNHYINLRPLLADENIARGDRMNVKDIQLYLTRLKDYASKITY